MKTFYHIEKLVKNRQFYCYIDSFSVYSKGEMGFGGTATLIFEFLDWLCYCIFEFLDGLCYCWPKASQLHLSFYYMFLLARILLAEGQLIIKDLARAMAEYKL